MGTAMDEVFKGLHEYYPGSRQKRRALTVRNGKTTSEPRTGGEWDSRPVIKTLNGREVQMFTIGALAKAIGKAEGTIRNYQAKGYLPVTPYRLPSRVVNGETRAGRRLFTRSMIEAAIESFENRGLVGTPRVEWRDHPDLPGEIAESWKSIQLSLSN